MTQTNVRGKRQTTLDEKQTLFPENLLLDEIAFFGAQMPTLNVGLCKGGQIGRGKNLTGSKNIYIA